MARKSSARSTQADAGAAKKRSKGARKTKRAGARAGQEGGKRTGTSQHPVLLGELCANGIAGSLYGLIERGVARQPKLARSTRGTVLLRFKEDFARVRIRFDADGITVEDVADARRGRRPDLTVTGSLPDIVHLATAPLIGGIPRPTDARGRAALARFAGGQVKIDGSPLLARRLLKLLEI